LGGFREADKAHCSAFIKFCSALENFSWSGADIIAALLPAYFLRPVTNFTQFNYAGSRQAIRKGGFVMTKNAAPTTAHGAPGAARVAVTTAVNFDAAIGVDASALNATIAAAFPTVHPLIFPRPFKVPSENLSGTIDLLAPPTVEITPPTALQAEAQAAVSKSGLTGQHAQSAIAGLLTGSVTVSCANVQAVITYTGQPSVTVGASVQVSAAVSLANTTTGWSATVTLSHAEATVPNEPELSALLTNVAAPLLLDDLNNHVLSAIHIPGIDLLGVNLKAPVIAEEKSGSDDFLVAYAGLGPNPVVAPPGGTAWPAGTLFAAVDATAIEAVAAKVLPEPGDTWWGPSGGWGSVSAGYSVTLSNPVLQVPAPGSGDQVTVSIDLSADARFTYHTPDGLPNITPRGTVSGGVTVGARVTARADGQSQAIYLAFDQASAHDLLLTVSLGIIPIPVADLDPLLDVIGAAATAALQNFAIKIWTLPLITLGFAGEPDYVLVPRNVALQSIAGPEKVAMEAVTFGLSITKKD
jgi:hypothetical protein